MVRFCGGNLQTAGKPLAEKQKSGKQKAEIARSKAGPDATRGKTRRNQRPIADA
jgi:hypothetical protein